MITIDLQPLLPLLKLSSNGTARPPVLLRPLVSPPCLSSILIAISILLASCLSLSHSKFRYDACAPHPVFLPCLSVSVRPQRRLSSPIPQALTLNTTLCRRVNSLLTTSGQT